MPGGAGFLPSAVPVQFMVDLSKFSGSSCWSSRDIEAACWIGRFQVRMVFMRHLIPWSKETSKMWLE